MKKAIILAIFVTSVFVFAPVAQALTPAVTVEDLQKQIQMLVAQIAELKSRLSQYEGNMPARICFVRNLRVGDAGTDVLELHQLLEQEGFTIQSTIKNNFTEQTASAVVGLQEKYITDILKPYGLMRGTGYVGPSTRAFLNKRCVQPRSTLDPIILGVEGPTVLKVGEVGTWMVKATDPKNGSLSYSIDWGDKVFIANTSGPSVTEDTSVKQVATFTHSYATAGTYTTTFTVRNQLGGVAKTTLSVSVGGAFPDGLMYINSPQGGEQWVLGTQKTILWTHNSNTKDLKSYSITIQSVPPLCTGTVACPAYSPSPYLVIAKLTGVTNYIWNVGTIVGIQGSTNTAGVVPLGPGKYIIRVCEERTNLCAVSKPFAILLESFPTI